MSLVVLCSASGAPGVTTAGLALTWVWAQAVPGRRAILVDADPAGSGLLPGFLEAGIPAGGGVLGLATERGLSPDALVHHAVSLDPGETRLVLTGVTEPVQARPLTSTWSGLVEVARDADAGGLDVVVDAGRIGHRWEPTPLIEAADTVVVVTRGSLAGVAAARSALRAVRECRGPGAHTTVLVIDGSGPYSTAEIATALDVEPLPPLPLDPRTARALSRGGSSEWRLTRSPLLRDAASVAVALRDRTRPLPARMGAEAP